MDGWEIRRKACVEKKRGVRERGRGDLTSRPGRNESFHKFHPRADKHFSRKSYLSSNSLSESSLENCTRARASFVSIARTVNAFAEHRAIDCPRLGIFLGTDDAFLTEYFIVPLCFILKQELDAAKYQRAKITYANRSMHSIHRVFTE